MTDAPPATFRARLHRFLEPGIDDSRLERAFNLAMIALICVNVVAVCLETVPEIFVAHATAFVLLEAFSVTVFTIELFLRTWAAGEDPRYAGFMGRVRFLLHPISLLDLLAVLPFYLAFFGVPLDLRFARVVRVLRVFVVLRLVRYSRALRTLGTVIRNQQEELVVTAMIGGVLLLFASATMYYVEHDAQPLAFPSIPAALWWGVITLATVGYGDVYPITPLGRVLGGLFAVLGVGLFALPAGIIASGFTEELRRKDELDDRCPHCGKAPHEALDPKRAALLAEGSEAA